LAGCLAAGAAQGAESALEVEGDGNCPSPGAVRSAILQLTSEERRLELPKRARVRVVDRGKTYDVVVQSERGSVERSFDDAQRDCERRVRFAAVFAVVTLLPPDIGRDAADPGPPPPPAPEPPAPPPVRPTPPAIVPEPRSVRLELGLSAELAPGVGGGLRGSSVGVELRCALGRAPLSALIAIGYAPVGRFSITQLDGELLRIPGAVGARLELARLPLALALDGAVVGAIERFSSTDLQHTASATIVELGARVGVVASLAVEAGITPFVGAAATLFPMVRDITIAPSGVVGRTSPLWLGGVAGLAFGL
jgi:hypothetical protein